MNIGYRIQKSKKKAELHITYSLILTIKLEKFAPYFLLSICMQNKAAKSLEWTLDFYVYNDLL